MTSPQKAKGNSWERLVAKDLSARYGETFIRVPNSGAYIGGSNTKRKQVLHEGQIRSFKGDIMPGPSFPKFNCECKNYADFPFHHFFTGTITKLDKWIEQCMEVADEGDFNIIFMKFNRKGTFVATQAHPQISLSRHFSYNSPSHGTWHIMEYSNFWSLNQDTVKSLCK
jgi:hypothetical protein